MAVLTTEQKRKVAQRFVRRAYKELQTTANLNTDDIDAAIQTTEDWVVDNQSSFNTSLPATFKNTATVEQKSLLLVYVIMQEVGLI